MATLTVQIRIPEELVKEIDRWISEGRFASRSVAVRTIVVMHRERERTREFYEVLQKRSDQITEDPSILVPVDKIG
jgi:Arc/MetJ-type ribon-helix-helix transcriptional regulator